MSTQPAPAPSPRVTTTALRAMKESGTPIVVLTAYDFNSARLVEAAGVDAVLVGDSLGMTMLGLDSTLPVTMDDMVRHTAAVSRACSRALVIADMPFGSYQVSIEEAVRNGVRLLAEGGAHAVKVEGADNHTLDVVVRLVDAGIPVMGHVGLTPQSVNTLGGYRTQGKDAATAAMLLDDCVSLELAGAFSVVLECIPAELAARATELVEIPTIGIGAGPDCDGEVQVFHDLLGLGQRKPRHAKRYAEIGAAIQDAVEAYASEVRSKAFPTAENTTSIDPEVLAQAELIAGADFEMDE